MKSVERGDDDGPRVKKYSPFLRLIAVISMVLIEAIRVSAQVSLRVGPILGPAPKISHDASSHPELEPGKLNLIPGFMVNGSSREEVRQFYNAIYPASEEISIDSSAVIANCDPGMNSSAFQNAELVRINWFRAMSGIPANVTLSLTEGLEAQAAALMISANNQLQHTQIPTNWICYDAGGVTAAGVSDIAIGVNGPDAITGYMWDYGSDNSMVPHRRWILFPQTQIMAVGDVPAQGTNQAANATWIYDGLHYNEPRPADTPPFVAWPPPGYVPAPVVYPQWSLGLSNADMSMATVTMQSNGVPMNVIVQVNAIDYAENSVVWYPASLDPSQLTTVFPFNGADTVYSVTVSNALTMSGPQNFSYQVTVFDPDVAGTDHVPTVINGPASPTVNASNPYTCNASVNPNVTGYQWVASQPVNGNLADNVQHGLTNFTIFPAPIYSVITNAANGSGKCFHLTHTNAVTQLLQLTEALFPGTNTSLSFQSQLGYATTNEIARAQYSTNGGQSWVDLFTQLGTDGMGQTTFVNHKYSLANCAGLATTLRFDYDYVGGLLYSQSTPNVGWSLEHILITNALRLTNFTTNVTATPDFGFIPTATGPWVLEARGMIFDQYGLDWSAPVRLAVGTNIIVTTPPVVVMGSPTLSAGQAQIPFVLTGNAASFQLLQAGQLNGAWTTAVAALSTTPGQNSYQFTLPFPGATTFYRVVAK
ncbi:MAG TPA: hypothetical protein VGO67_02630 [Verrucomicrobiae bacterium]